MNRIDLVLANNFKRKLQSRRMILISTINPTSIATYPTTKIKIEYVYSRLVVSKFYMSKSSAPRGHLLLAKMDFRFAFRTKQPGNSFEVGTFSLRNSSIQIK